MSDSPEFARHGAQASQHQTQHCNDVLPSSPSGRGTALCDGPLTTSLTSGTPPLQMFMLSSSEKCLAVMLDLSCKSDDAHDAALPTIQLWNFSTLGQDALRFRPVIWKRHTRPRGCPSLRRHALCSLGGVERDESPRQVLVCYGLLRSAAALRNSEPATMRPFVPPHLRQASTSRNDSLRHTGRQQRPLGVLRPRGSAWHCRD